MVDLYENDTTIDPQLVREEHRTPATKQRVLEAAVLALLG